MAFRLPVCASCKSLLSVCLIAGNRECVGRSCDKVLCQTCLCRCVPRDPDPCELCPACNERTETWPFGCDVKIHPSKLGRINDFVSRLNWDAELWERKDGHRWLCTECFLPFVQPLYRKHLCLARIATGIIEIPEEIRLFISSLLFEVGYIYA